MAATAFLESFPFKNRQKPSATQMTSVQTMVVELATEVCLRDSNHNAKCTARNTPLRQLSRMLRLPAILNSDRVTLLPNVTGLMSKTVHNRR